LNRNPPKGTSGCGSYSSYQNLNSHVVGCTGDARVLTGIYFTLTLAEIAITNFN
jgi:hypothetical protein